VTSLGHMVLQAGLGARRMCSVCLQGCKYLHPVHTLLWSQTGYSAPPPDNCITLCSRSQPSWVCRSTGPYSAWSLSCSTLL
jgi:hypothetical protein